jgi:AraC-like DNA-binding protein
VERTKKPLEPKRRPTQIDTNRLQGVCRRLDALRRRSNWKRGTATVNQRHAASHDSSSAPQFEHCEETTDHLPEEDVRPSWEGIVERHLVGPLSDPDSRVQVEIAIPLDVRFKARVRSGHIGSLQYCRIWSNQSHYAHRSTAHMSLRHTLSLVVSGRLSFGAGQTSVQAGPGDFVLLKDLRHVVVSHDRPVESVTLFDPLQRDALDHFGSHLVHCTAGSDAAAMASRWIQDACSDRGWQSGSAADSMAQVVRALASEVMREHSAAPRLRLDRVSIERQVMHRLDDPALSLAELANTFGCSLRTLHRVFRRDGEESLERYIQRRRIEACAVRLRGSESAHSLTELALQFGFSSSSHFSSAFRAHFGVSPSVYRKGCGTPQGTDAMEA